MTRRDMVHAVGRRMRLLSPEQSAEAWQIVARRLEDDLSAMDIPKFVDLMATIRAATIIARGQACADDDGLMQEWEHPVIAPNRGP